MHCATDRANCEFQNNMAAGDWRLSFLRCAEKYRRDVPYKGDKSSEDPSGSTARSGGRGSSSGRRHRTTAPGTERAPSGSTAGSSGRRSSSGRRHRTAAPGTERAPSGSTAGSSGRRSSSGRSSSTSRSSGVLRERIAQLESTVQRLAGTAVRRPAAIFDPLKAMALMESLMDTARNEGHEKAEEFKLYINKGHFQTVCDDKSGYDHVLITETSKPLVGFQWGGWYYVCNTIAFGWKCSGYVYQKIGLVAMHKIRSLGVSSSLYIDDRHAGQLQLAVNAFDWSNYELAEAACFLLCYTLVDLGYTLGLDKSQLEPTQLPTFLGMGIDSLVLAFRLLNRKKVTVAQLREDILQQTEVPVKLLQKLTGKIGSFVLAVPAARLFCREMFPAIAEAEKQGRMVKIEGTVRKELEYWRFLDTWEGHIPWKPEKHEVVELSSDASGFRWAGVVSSDKDMTQCSDYWEQQETPEHISVKETRALTRTLISALLVAGPGQARGEGAKGSSSRRVGTTVPNQETGVDAETNEMGPLGFPDSASMFQGAARVWVPAVNCSECWYPNDFDCNFCQKCGKPREGQNAKNKGRCLEVNLTEINARYDEIMGTQENSAYGKQKRVLAGLLSEFLAALNPPKTLENAAPSDIVKFLIFKDDVGKTKVHKAGCQSNGPGLEACVCPNRLAFKTVDSHIGKLRAIFNERGKGGEWDERLGLGNPAASLVVKKYLKSVTEGQLQQGLTPRQAKPVFLEKIVKVCKLIEQRRQLETSAIKIFILARDEAIFKALFFAGDRVSDLMRCRTDEVALDNAFRRYLEKAGLYEGETLHGCRAGCAISLHMAGASDDSVMNHIGWYNRKTASHYMRIAQSRGEAITRRGSGKRGRRNPEEKRSRSPSLPPSPLHNLDQSSRVGLSPRDSRHCPIASLGLASRYAERIDRANCEFQINMAAGDWRLLEGAFITKAL
ncbi:hypothetical protein Bbelb_370130 [Branchiostoma belcheri]|nr:hypothetical protein Bbelb_370130 [Branchiostoma belcheri]